MNDDVFNIDTNVSDVSSQHPLSLNDDVTALESMTGLTDDSFQIIDDDLDILVDKSKNVTPDDDTDDVMLGSKMCPTRHGCTGATNCNYDYASYPG